MTAVLPIGAAHQDPDSLKELASIARLITYARQSAKNLNAEFPVWFLDLAPGAVLQEMSATACRIPCSKRGRAQQTWWHTELIDSDSRWDLEQCRYGFNRPYRHCYFEQEDSAKN